MNSRLVRQQPVCTECGSPDIEAHAAVSWSEQTQDWRIAEVFKRCNCSGCGNTDTAVKWINPD